ncbi:Cytochrome P450 9e2 [Blattella germanica]|nr:Cytochrome P450 9e2 [Blattella germanica]
MAFWIWVTILIIITLIIYFFGKKNHDYFSKRKVPYLKASPYIGNMGPIIFKKLPFSEFLLKMYNDLKGHPYGGIFEFMNPTLLLRDPELIKKVTVKDFEFFLDHRQAMNGKVEPLFGKGLFSLNAVSNFFRFLVQDSIQTRESRGIIRPDMIHLLMQAKNGTLKSEENTKMDGNSIPKPKWDADDLTAQAFLFFVAGFETASTLLSFISHLLAVYPDIQNKLQDEIDQSLTDNDGKFTYESIHNMKYLDMVVSETLRLYPPAVVTDRKCVKEYNLPSEPPITLKPGDLLWLPIFALHRDPEYFPNPEKFDPERFSEENKNNIRPYTYIPFGAGPRNCIGNRFALMETKIALVHLLSSFNLKVVSKTPIPLKLTKNSFSMNVDGGFWIGLEERILT